METEDRKIHAQPTRKVTASTLGGAAAAIFAWLLSELAGVNMPPGIEAAVATIVGAVLGYFVPEAEKHNV